MNMATHQAFLVNLPCIALCADCVFNACSIPYITYSTLSTSVAYHSMFRLSFVRESSSVVLWIRASLGRLSLV